MPTSPAVQLSRQQLSGEEILLLSGVAGPIIIQTSAKTAGMGISIFFCVLTSLISVEIAWNVYPEMKEQLDFVEGAEEDE